MRVKNCKKSYISSKYSKFAKKLFTLKIYQFLTNVSFRLLIVNGVILVSLLFHFERILRLFLALIFFDFG